MAKKIINSEVVKLEHFEGELEFECTGKSKHLPINLKIILHFDVAKVFKRLGYIK